MSDCDVCIGGWDGDPPEMYVDKMVRARKPHKCYECNRRIQPGEEYNRVVGKWDGEFGQYTFCSECHEIQTAFSCDNSRLFGCLWEEIEEYLFPEMNTGCLSKLTTAKAKAFLMDRWRKWKGLAA